MEGSDGRETFESLDLNPQLFINEALNTVDDLVDGAFDFFYQEASTLLKIGGVDRSADLKKGVDYVRNKVQATLDKRLNMWEHYSLHHCFSVPEGFSLTDKNEPPLDAIDQDNADDQQLDEQLEFLRNKLAQVGSETADLNRQAQILEKQLALSNHYTSAVNEVLQLYEEKSVQNMFEEMMRTATELQAKTEKLKQREDNVRNGRLGVNYANEDLTSLKFGKGLSDLKLVELEGFLEEMKKA